MKELIIHKKHIASTIKEHITYQEGLMHPMPSQKELRKKWPQSKAHKTIIENRWVWVEKKPKGTARAYHIKFGDETFRVGKKDRASALCCLMNDLDGSVTYRGHEPTKRALIRQAYLSGEVSLNHRDRIYRAYFQCLSKKPSLGQRFNHTLSALSNPRASSWSTPKKWLGGYLPIHYACLPADCSNDARLAAATEDIYALLNLTQISMGPLAAASVVLTRLVQEQLTKCAATMAGRPQKDADGIILTMMADVAKACIQYSGSIPNSWLGCVQMALSATQTVSHAGLSSLAAHWGGEDSFAHTIGKRGVSLLNMGLTAQAVVNKMTADGQLSELELIELSQNKAIRLLVQQQHPELLTGVTFTTEGFTQICKGIERHFKAGNYTEARRHGVEEDIRHYEYEDGELTLSSRQLKSEHDNGHILRQEFDGEGALTRKILEKPEGGLVDLKVKRIRENTSREQLQPAPPSVPPVMSTTLQTVVAMLPALSLRNPMGLALSSLLLSQTAAEAKFPQITIEQLNQHFLENPSGEQHIEDVGAKIRRYELFLDDPASSTNLAQLIAADYFTNMDVLKGIEKENPQLYQQLHSVKHVLMRRLESASIKARVIAGIEKAEARSKAELAEIRKGSFKTTIDIQNRYPTLSWPEIISQKIIPHFNSQTERILEASKVKKVVEIEAYICNMIKTVQLLNSNHTEPMYRDFVQTAARHNNPQLIFALSAYFPEYNLLKEGGLDYKKLSPTMKKIVTYLTNDFNTNLDESHIDSTARLDDYGNTIAHMDAMKGTPLSRLQYDDLSGWDAPNQFGWTPIHYAIATGRDEDLFDNFKLVDGWHTMKGVNGESLEEWIKVAKPVLLLDIMEAKTKENPVYLSSKDDLPKIKKLLENEAFSIADLPPSKERIKRIGQGDSKRFLSEKVDREIRQNALRQKDVQTELETLIEEMEGAEGVEKRKHKIMKWLLSTSKTQPNNIQFPLNAILAIKAIAKDRYFTQWADDIFKGTLKEAYKDPHQEALVFVLLASCPKTRHSREKVFTSEYMEKPFHVALTLNSMREEDLDLDLFKYALTTFRAPIIEEKDFDTIIKNQLIHTLYHPNEFGWTPVHMALMTKNIHTINYFLSLDPHCLEQLGPFGLPMDKFLPDENFVFHQVTLQAIQEGKKLNAPKETPPTQKTKIQEMNERVQYTQTDPPKQDTSWWELLTSPIGVATSALGSLSTVGAYILLNQRYQQAKTAPSQNQIMCDYLSGSDVLTPAISIKSKKIVLNLDQIKFPEDPNFAPKEKAAIVETSLKEVFLGELEFNSKFKSRLLNINVVNQQELTPAKLEDFQTKFNNAIQKAVHTKKIVQTKVKLASLEDNLTKFEEAASQLRTGKEISIKTMQSHYETLAKEYGDREGYKPIQTHLEEKAQVCKQALALIDQDEDLVKAVQKVENITKEFKKDKATLKALLHGEEESSTRHDTSNNGGAAAKERKGKKKKGATTKLIKWDSTREAQKLATIQKALPEIQGFSTFCSERGLEFSVSLESDAFYLHLNKDVSTAFVKAFGLIENNKAAKAISKANSKGNSGKLKIPVNANFSDFRILGNKLLRFLPKESAKKTPPIPSAELTTTPATSIHPKKRVKKNQHTPEAGPATPNTPEKEISKKQGDQTPAILTVTLPSEPHSVQVREGTIVEAISYGAGNSDKIATYLVELNKTVPSKLPAKVQGRADFHSQELKTLLKDTPGPDTHSAGGGAAGRGSVVFRNGLDSLCSVVHEVIAPKVGGGAIGWNPTRKPETEASELGPKINKWIGAAQEIDGLPEEEKMTIYKNHLSKFKRLHLAIRTAKESKIPIPETLGRAYYMAFIMVFNIENKLKTKPTPAFSDISTLKEFRNIAAHVAKIEEARHFINLYEAIEKMSDMDIETFPLTPAGLERCRTHYLKLYHLFKLSELAGNDKKRPDHAHHGIQDLQVEATWLKGLRNRLMHHHHSDFLLPS